MILYYFLIFKWKFSIKIAYHKKRFEIKRLLILLVKYKSNDIIFNKK